MKKIVTIVITLLGFGATVLNTISVEQKSTQLEDTDAVVEAMEQELESRELNYRLAVQEFNFSTLHAASAYDIDGNHKVLGASVAPGTTLIETKEADGVEKKRLSFRELTRKKASEAKAKLRVRRPPPGQTEPAPRKKQKKRIARPSFFANLTQARAPDGPPKPDKSGPGKPGPGKPGPGKPGPGEPGPGKGEPRKRMKLAPKVRAAFAPVADRVSAARPHTLTPDQRRKVIMIRGFQIENLSRWRQYLHLASTGEAMTEEEVAEWESLLAESLVQGKEGSITVFKEQCGDSVQGWEGSYDEGRAALEEETGRKTALEKQIDRSKSVYMGLMLVGLVLVTLKDLFGKSDG